MNEDNCPECGETMRDCPGNHGTPGPYCQDCGTAADMGSGATVCFPCAAQLTTDN